MTARRVPTKLRKPESALRPTGHPLKYKVAGDRLICSTCKRGIAGARTGFTGKWSGGQHVGS